MVCMLYFSIFCSAYTTHTKLIICANLWWSSPNRSRLIQVNPYKVSIELLRLSHIAPPHQNGAHPHTPLLGPNLISPVVISMGLLQRWLTFVKKRQQFHVIIFYLTESTHSSSSHLGCSHNNFWLVMYLFAFSPWGTSMELSPAEIVAQ